jgi:hypothetical protein
VTVSTPAEDVRARTHTPTPPTARRTTSRNTPGRPPLRVVPDITHNPDEAKARSSHSAAADHLADVADDLNTHPVTATHPPTVVEAAGRIWLSADEVRHGLAGQLAAAAVGLVQVIGLALCWATAHVFFADKIRTALFLLVLTTALTAYAVASYV